MNDEFSEPSLFATRVPRSQLSLVVKTKNTLHVTHRRRMKIWHKFRNEEEKQELYVPPVAQALLFIRKKKSYEEFRNSKFANLLAGSRMILNVLHPPLCVA